MFFILENGFSLYLLNIIKNIMHDFVRYMFKIAMQSLKAQVSCCKTHRIKDIILKNTNSYNLDIISKLEVVNKTASPDLLQKVEPLLLPSTHNSD